MLFEHKRERRDTAYCMVDNILNTVYKLAWIETLLHTRPNVELRDILDALSGIGRDLDIIVWTE